MSLLNSKDHIKEIAQQINQKAYGYGTGFIDLDKTLMGLHQSELMILAGRPSMGKTALMANIAARSAVQVPQIIFSLEMPATKLFERMLADIAEIPYRKLKEGLPLDEKEQARYKAAIVKLENRPLYIEDRSCITPNFIRKCCEQVSEKIGKEFIVYIDYLQLMSADNFKSARYLEIDEIVAQLRGIAKDFDIPIVATCQLNREIDRRTNHEPRLSDLRESGSIEQAADTVILLHRPSYYKMKEIDLETEDDGEAFFMIAKQRNGATGKIPMIWIPELMAFRCLGSLEENTDDLYQQPEPKQEESEPEESTNPDDVPLPEWMNNEPEDDDSDEEVGVPNPEFIGDEDIPEDEIPF